ncbi:iron-containing redox enzyme family protein [Candidatus Nitronereus thalassa]|uniref:Iron-containing redox enzyme family protein n=1 Tax=Candidatus Nitronereus thalassa TaxID=3020898 RepID=A0ABU3K490_9BACT|nr:iron-containing redox enzyme family protein [Candidatus Nitronereus thalassa]MDT7041207.1 iron-containing redox enzyme family protein [Candidatus Nitronereus thalassa]
MPASVDAALQTDRYAQWLKDIVHETSDRAHAVAHHEAWYQFSDASIPSHKHHALLIGFWPLIERFPQFLALNLLKCVYGEDVALNRARGWLVKNLRIEQRHAEWYRDWAECAGISREKLYRGDRPAASTAITDWCWHICESGGLAEGMAATNFAIEGVTGDWCEMVWRSPHYRTFFPENQQKKAMKWIQAHAAYDDLHPIEALDIIYALLGDNPDTKDIQKVKSAILKSLDLYHLALETGMAVGYAPAAFGTDRADSSTK